MVVIYKNNVTKLKQHGVFDKKDIQLHSLSHYLIVAKKCIGKYADSSIVKKMLCDEDAISYVVEKIIYGNYTYRSDKNCTLNTYLNVCAKFAVKNWINKLKSTRKIQTLDSFLYKTLAVKSKSIIDKNIPIFNSITKQQQKHLQMRYVYGMTYQEIGNLYHISRQAIQQSIKLALIKIKNNG